MLKLIEMDDSVTLQQQMMTETGPVILINRSRPGAFSIGEVQRITPRGDGEHTLI